VLREAGIPETEWPSWHVDHEPRYPLLGPDHSLYRLTPRRHGEHSRLTIGQTRAGVRATWRRMKPRPGELFSELDLRQPLDLIEDW